MGLMWIRLDTSLVDNPKALAVITQWRDGRSTMFSYICGLAYSGAHGTDGFIPQEALPFIHGKLVDANRLVTVGFWNSVPGGWTINGWEEYQASDQETRARRDRAQRAAEARWSKD